MRRLSILTAAVTASAILTSAAPAFARDFPSNMQQPSRRGVQQWAEQQHDQRRQDRQDRRQQRRAEGLENADATCMRPVVAAHESAIQSAYSTFSASMTAALKARATALDTAWSSTDGSSRQDLIKSAREAYRETMKDARETMKDARKDAWDTYKDAAKNCGVTVSDDEASDDMMDNEMDM